MFSFVLSLSSVCTSRFDSNFENLCKSTTRLHRQRPPKHHSFNQPTDCPPQNATPTMTYRSQTCLLFSSVVAVVRQPMCPPTEDGLSCFLIPSTTTFTYRVLYRPVHQTGIATRHSNDLQPLLDPFGRLQGQPPCPPHAPRDLDALPQWRVHRVHVDILWRLPWRRVRKERVVVLSDGEFVSSPQSLLAEDVLL